MRTLSAAIRIPVTDTAKLASEICRGPYRSAFPKSLPDRWIMPLARDLRKIECAMAADDDSEDLGEHGPLLVAIHVIRGRLLERGLDPSTQLPLEGFTRWLSAFQIMLEREIVTRTTGISTLDHDGPLIAALDREIDAAFEQIHG